MAAILWYEKLGPLLMAGLGGVLLGVMAVLLKRREGSARHETARYFLMNETGNVVISTSIKACTQLPESTVAQFSEALAHLSAVFYAITKRKNQNNGHYCSLYNYEVIKKELARHPVFICTSSEKPRVPRKQLDRSHQALGESRKGMPEKKQKEWIEDRANCSRTALRMEGLTLGQNRLHAIHAQMYAEAQRLKKRYQFPLTAAKTSAPQPGSQPPIAQEQLEESDAVIGNRDQDSSNELVEVPDHMEIAHMTLYCECLMGVTVVSLKLVHGYFEDYLHSDSLGRMESDNYLFVSPAQLQKAMHAFKDHG